MKSSLASYIGAFLLIAGGIPSICNAACTCNEINSSGNYYCCNGSTPPNTKNFDRCGTESNSPESWYQVGIGKCTCPSCTTSPSNQVKWGKPSNMPTNPSRSSITSTKNER